MERHALANQPNGPASGENLLALIRRLGFVQVDSINTVERAHHMILWSRRQTYRPEALRRMLESDRTLFEHWTHDASIIPTEFLPHWRLRFVRDAENIRARYRNWRGAEFEEKLDGVIRHITEHGPVGTRDVGLGERRSKGGWWEWHPSKTALEYLWRTGRLAVTRRKGFAKIYDLAERVYPACVEYSEECTINWACGEAIDRLGFATSGEIAAFWGKVSPQEVKVWARQALRRSEIEEVEVTGVDGSFRRSYARPGLDAAAAEVPDLPNRIRILSPFDPALRDRNRAHRLFGFRYRIEVFVPEAQRQYGYYVFPVMECDRLIGRIDVRACRADDSLHVTAFWPENDVRMGKGRLTRLEAELSRLARFVDCRRVSFENFWLRSENF